ncbi:hypothetical protein ACHAXT_011616 [Thalassiosira profunda]
MSFNKKRAMTPKGQMSGNGSGPAIMMMPPHIRATFMPNPPLKHLPPFKRHVRVDEVYVTDDEDKGKRGDGVSGDGKAVGPSGVSKIPTSFPKKKRGAGLSGAAAFLHHFERTAPPERKINPTPKSLREEKVKAKKAENEKTLAPQIEAYRKEQAECGGEFTNGMNCYNSLFVGRLAYEVTERKLLREMEAYGPVKDLKLVKDKKTGRSKGYAFVEYEHEEDMKRAFRAADGMRLEGRSIVVDVERGHTVPNWLPRKFGGGLGGTRLGGKDKNVVIPGRYDPSKAPPPGMGHMGPGGPGGMGPPGGHYGGGGGYRGGPPMGGPGGYGGGGGRYEDPLAAPARSLALRQILSRSGISARMSSSAASIPSLADLCDDHVHSPQRLSVVEPCLFSSYGKKPRFHGKIETVRCFESNPVVRTVLSSPGENRVLVVDGGGSKRVAILGDQIAKLAVDNSWAGVVVNGCLRDSAIINELDIGVKALGTHPVKSLKTYPGEKGVAVNFGGVEFVPGQWLYSDEDGIIVSDVPIHNTGDEDKVA